MTPCLSCAEYFRLLRLTSLEELCLNTSFSLCFPQTCQGYRSLPPLYLSKEGFCLFIFQKQRKSANEFETNSQVSCKLCKWKPVTTNTRLTLQQISSIQHLPTFTSLTVNGSSFPPLAQSFCFIKASAQIFLVSSGEKIA